MPLLPKSCSSALANAEKAIGAGTALGGLLVAAEAAFAIEDWPVGLGLLAAAAVEANKFSVTGAAALNAAYACINAFLTSIGVIGGGKKMACTTTHSGGRISGPGLCCNALAQGLLTKPPAGTTLPPYAPGDARAGRIPAGRIANVTDAAGHCASCMIVGSKAPKHLGQPVLKYIRGGPGCATAGTGCCAMAA